MSRIPAIGDGNLVTAIGLAHINAVYLEQAVLALRQDLNPEVVAQDITFGPFIQQFEIEIRQITDNEPRRRALETLSGHLRAALDLRNDVAHVRQYSMVDGSQGLLRRRRGARNDTLLDAELVNQYAQQLDDIAGEAGDIRARIARGAL